MKRISTVLAASVAALVFTGAGTAFAGDCFIASRSDQGDAAATHSSRWVSVSVDAFAHSPDFPSGFDPDCFVEEWLGNGGPAAFTTRSNKVIGEGSSNPNLADGRGLDHIEDAYGALFGASLQACAI